MNGTGVDQTLIEGWNGTAWTVMPSPNQGSDLNILQSVSCLSPNDCEAIGYYYTPSVSGQTLVETWNGSEWSTVPSPNVGTGANILWGVSCATSSTSSMCKAVGYTYIGSAWRSLALTSTDDGPWLVDETPNASSKTNALISVSCASIVRCESVGVYYNTDAVQRTLAETWSGGRWKLQPSPNRGTGRNYLQGVSCPSSTTCIAVGNSVKNRSGHNLIERWNGSSWIIMPSPTPSGGNEVATGVSCVLLNRCTEVGYYVERSTILTLVESWNGSTWTVVPSANPASQSTLYGDACVSKTLCTGAGGSNNSTLIESGA